MICESSSFQLEDAEAFAPECAVLLNVTPDHLDRHGTLEAYLDAKLRIFANQGNDDVAVDNGDDPLLRGRDLGGCARRIAFCRTAEADDCDVVCDGETIVAAGEPLIGLGELKLLGPHNAENAMAAAAAALAMGVERDAVAAGLAELRGRPAPARAGRRDRRRHLRQRLEGDQRRRGRAAILLASRAASTRSSAAAPRARASRASPSRSPSAAPLST